MASSEQNGWIQSIDPQSGRTFYANRYTRTTQWDPPPGWKDPSPSRNGSHGRNGFGGANGRNGRNGALDSNGGIGGNSGIGGIGGNDLFSGGAQNQHPYQQPQQQQHYQQQHQHQQQQQQLDQLPDGWEEMKDPKSGRTFYIDHARKITTWERPSSGTSSTTTTNKSSSRGSGMGGGTGGGRSVASNGSSSSRTMNQFGSHSQWAEDPRKGSRHSGRTSHSYNHYNDHSNYSSYHNLSEQSSHPGPPQLDFTAVSVPDALRSVCPGCSQVFSITKRRHHCRLCGDVFCDACSSSRTVLPLSGPEFDTPVRVCDWCMKDVKKGNYFSLRRYLTPLQLYDPNAIERETKNKVEDGAGSGETTKQITLDTVAASLSSLSVDIHALTEEPTSFQEKITIPASILIPAIAKHLKHRKTAEYAIRVLASLVMLGSVVGEDSFGLAMLGIGEEGDGTLPKVESTNSVPSLASDGSKAGTPTSEAGEIMSDVLSILEWHGSDGRTLSAQEQAAKVIYYMTEPSFIAGVLSREEAKASQLKGQGEVETNEGPVDLDAAESSAGDSVPIDIHRAFRSMLDHTTSSNSPSLQRWATSSLRHLITEDQRRACLAATDGRQQYESFTSQLVSSGGIMILCSLLNSDDSDTRAHATGALESIVIATREIGLTQNKGNRTRYRAGRGTESDAAIVDAIVSNGGCGPSLAHLLISADESVVLMGCAFATSLLSPLLTDPRGSGRALQQCTSTARSGLGFESKDDGLGSYRHAALALVVGKNTREGAVSSVSCLPALIQILRSGVEEHSWGGQKARSMKLQVMAGECLAAIALAVGHIVGSSRTNHDSLSGKAHLALEVMEHERMYEVAYKLVASSNFRSLDPTRNTPQSRLREASGLMLLALSSCSNTASSYLISNRAVSGLLAIAGESGMLTAPSALRGAWASRGLCFIEASTTLLIQAWKNTRRSDNMSSTSPLNLLLEALDAGAVGVASKVVTGKVELNNHDRAYSMIRVKIAACFMLSAMFGIARADDENAVGTSRLYGAIDADCAAALAYSMESNGMDGRSDLVASTMNLFRATAPYAHRFSGHVGSSDDETLPMVDLLEACLLAAGGMCGAMTGCFASDAVGSIPSDNVVNEHMVMKSSDFGPMTPDKFSHSRRDASSMACNILTMRVDHGAFLPSVLIGTVGESCIVPAMRLALSISQQGQVEMCGELVRSGMLVPVCDILQNSLSSGDRYTFSAAIGLVRFCGPCANISSSDGSLTSLKSSIRTLSSLLFTSEHASLKFECLNALEALSSNQSLHNAISEDALPALAQFLTQLEGRRLELEETEEEEMIYSSLKTIRHIISLPSYVVAISNSGIVSSLSRLISQHRCKDSKIQEICLELLHSLASVKRNDFNLVSSGVFEAVTSILSERGISPKMTMLGLDVIDGILSDINPSSDPQLSQKIISSLVDQDIFLRALISTMMSMGNDAMIGDALIVKGDAENVKVPPLYGPPLALVGDDSDGHQGGKEKAVIILFRVSFLLCSDISGGGRDQFVRALMLKDVRGSAVTVAVASSFFLDILNDEITGICVPRTPAERSSFQDVQLPLVKNVILSCLSSSLSEVMSQDSLSKRSGESIIQTFKLPQSCLSLCKSQKYFHAAFDFLESTVLPLPIDTIGEMLLGDAETVISLFDFVTGKVNHSMMSDHEQQTFATILGDLAKAKLLPTAVERLELRRNAIAALSAAMLIHGSDDSIISEDESLPRICVDCLALILTDNAQGEIEMSTLEARAMASAIGKLLSSTVLNRFFTQASLETTLDHTLDHSIDRLMISNSSESRLLCALASSPESLVELGKVGGLEAISLIAHEGDKMAIKALCKACELDPESIVKVDAHISIMEALTSLEEKITTDHSNNEAFREIAIDCIRMITKLAENKETQLAISSTEQCLSCLEVAVSVISASSNLHAGDSQQKTAPPAEKSAPKSESTDTVEVNDTEADNKPETENGNSVTVESKSDSQIDGNDDDMNNDQETSTDGEKEQKWGLLLRRDNLSLENSSFNLLLSLVAFKEHRDRLMNDKHLIDSIVAAIKCDSLSLIDFQCHGLDLLSTFTAHLGKSNVGTHSSVILLEMLCSVIEDRMQALRITRDRQEQLGYKRLISLAVVGLQHLFGSFMNDNERSRSLSIASDLFVFLTDTLYKGSKSRRAVASKSDGILFFNLSSLFLLSLGNKSSCTLISTSRHVSSSIRFIMMTSGIDSLDCYIPIKDSDGGEYWDAAMTHSLIILSSLMNLQTQEALGVSYASLIEGVSQNSMTCLQLIGESKFPGASSLAARSLISKLECLPR